MEQAEKKKEIDAVKTGIIKSGQGGWDVTSYPFGGDFCRPSSDTPCEILDDQPMAGWTKVKYTRKGKGLRTAFFHAVTPILEKLKP